MREERRPFWFTAMIAVLLAVIFVGDTVTDLEIAVAVFYVAPILISVRVLPRRQVIWLSAICVVLTGTSCLFTRSGSPEAGLANLAISVTAILVTTWLGLRMIALEAASHEARAQLLRLSRITNLGELVTSIAHEVNQPLAAVTSSAGACRRWLDADPPNVERARESLDRVTAGAHHAAEVITRVRRLSSRQAPTPERTDIGELIGECAALARPELTRHGVTLVIDIDAGLPPVLVDRVQIQQVLTNLLLNAMEALGATDPAVRTIEIVAMSDADPRFVAITVIDNGAGLSKDAEQRLWEPFWTSKEGGTGLGLTISQAIVEAHGGRIAHRPTAGGGATFTLLLPSYRDSRHDR
jgi:C4-dicarboxylate-specific signal transduction histidine kinase